MKKVSTLLLSSLAIMLIAAFTSPTYAQGPGGRGNFGRGPGGDGIMGLVFNEQVQKEAEIVEDQVTDIRKVMDGMREKMRDLFSNMRGASEEEREEIFAKFREARTEIEEEVSTILLPHQVTRLRQIAFQQQLSRGGGSQALVRGRIAEELGLSEEQIESLQEKSQELEAELREKVQKLRDEAQQELFGVLTPEQQKKIKELMGDKFEMQRPEGRNFSSRGPGGRGPGGDGGRGDSGRRPPRDGEL